MNSFDVFVIKGIKGSNLLNFQLNLATLINVVLDIKILKIYASTEKNYK